MPIYEYNCPQCSKSFDILSKFEDVESCPECHIEMTRKISSPHFVFKGRGFYATDNPKPLKIPDDIANATEAELDRDLGLA